MSRMTRNTKDQITFVQDYAFVLAILIDEQCVCLDSYCRPPLNAHQARALAKWLNKAADRIESRHPARGAKE